MISVLVIVLMFVSVVEQETSSSRKKGVQSTRICLCNVKGEKGVIANR